MEAEKEPGEKGEEDLAAVQKPEFPAQLPADGKSARIKPAIPRR